MKLIYHVVVVLSFLLDRLRVITIMSDDKGLRR